ncbi:MAG: hypothetical protein PHR56_06505 [Dehalococcoidales bacterium]|nr:hypothetical protein [Dehalococcoidales bacterium]
MTDHMETETTELDTLKRERGAAHAELESRGSAIARLEKALAEKDGEMAALKQTLADTEGKLAAAGNSLAQAVGEYRSLVAGSQPGIPAELITGNTINEINESLQKARTIIERVKQEIEAEASKTRVPAGAPQRSPPDISALSPREKIQFAIGGNK